MLLFFIALIVLFPGQSSDANQKTPKIIESKRRVNHIKIDGKIGKREWAQASMLDGFIELRPEPGDKEKEGSHTVAYITYDDAGIYFGGICYEPSKEMISSELVGRDGFGNNDYVGLILDTYKDNINGFEYFITPLNEQWDAKIAPNNNGNDEDFSWNAVWESATFIGDNYWSFEVFIPFMAIRFAEKDIQDWGMNITRRRRKTEEQFFWNPIDPNVNGFLNQEGYLTGLKDIKPPIRLQLSPYVSYYANHFPQEGATNTLTSIFNGGMDLKWGINQAFTMDATLIPDFGQVQSDPQVFNLSPFEVRFDENRDFFTEGVELFNQGNLFYSRRIGGTPTEYFEVSNNLNDNEKLISNPTETKLLNASKISGRTSGGLGIGVLNAITDPTEAVVQDTITGLSWRVTTAPYINYNVVVLNQTMKNNSSVSLINTNVTRVGDFYDANVTGLTFDFNTKGNTWNTGGQVFSSQILNQNSKNSYGYSHLVYGGKTSGQWRFNVWQELADDRYNSNDLGFFTNNNYINQGFWIGYRDPEPKGWRNNLFLNWNARYSRLFTPIGNGNPMHQNAGLNFNVNLQTKGLHWMGGNINADIISNDFYEPRVSGRYFTRGGSGLIGMWFESNPNKKWSINPSLYYRQYVDFYDLRAMDLDTYINWRPNATFSIRFGGSWMPRWNSMGFTTTLDSEDDPVFARREIQTFVSTIRGKYSFTNRMGVTLVARHYMSGLQNKELFQLNDDGSLRPKTGNPSEYNRTVNFFNIDMVYTWQFAQGSFVNIVWKVAVNRFDDNFSANYLQNLNSTFQQNVNNTLSMRVIYFIDYNTMNNRFFGKR